MNIPHLAAMISEVVRLRRDRLVALWIMTNDPRNWLKNMVPIDRDRETYSLRIEDANGSPLTDFEDLPVEKSRRITKIHLSWS
jgi:hypothetical protein